MKLNRWTQNALATAVCAGLGLGLTSCGTSNTVDYLYLLSSKNNPGQVNVYRVDAQSGGLSQIPNSPYPAGRNPVGLVTSPNGKNLYVINHDDNTIIDYGIGTDAKLYPQHTYTTPGTEPVAIGINAAGTLLFVVDHYAPIFTDLNPGPGALVVYAIRSDSSLGPDSSLTTTGPVPQTLPSGAQANYYALDTAPSALTVLPNGNSVYVAEQLTTNATGCSAGQGAVVALSVASGGVVAPLTGSPFCAGQTPSAVTTNPAGGSLYVTDSTQNAVIGFNVNSDGTLAAIAGGVVGAGSFPDAITFDATGQFLYVANRDSNSIQSYSVPQNGVPVSTGTYATQAYPQCILVEPNLNRFIYTADFQGSGSTGYKLDPSTGMLTGTENSPYAGTGLATCLAATTHNKAGRG